MEKISFENGRGFAELPENRVLTFEVEGFSERDAIREKEYCSIYSKCPADNLTMRVDRYTVPLWGDGHNLYPQEVYSITGENKLLPELIHKQVKFLFGKGPRLYRETIRGEGDKQKTVRLPVDIPEIRSWLESWEENGYNHYWEYLKNLITDYYYVNTCVTKYEFSKARRLENTSLPKIRALTHIGADEARLATLADPLIQRIKNSDCRHVIVGGWTQPNRYRYEVYNRFDPSAPFRFPAAAAFNSERTFTRSVYALNEWFQGLYEWIKSSNLTPRYLNSYLKNALNAHIHVIIPGSWYNRKKEILENICRENLTGECPLQAEYRGVKLIDEKGKPIQFYETMVDGLIVNELKAITSMMSGEGKNQGKLWASTKWGQDG